MNALPVELYEINGPFVFACNESDDVSIVVHNVDTLKEAQAELKRVFWLIGERGTHTLDPPEESQIDAPAKELPT